MFVLDSLLIGGLRFVLEKVAAVAEHEHESVESLNRALLEAQQEREDGAITEHELAERERVLWTRLRELKQDGPGGLADAHSFDGIEVTIDHERT